MIKAAIPLGTAGILHSNPKKYLTLKEPTAEFNYISAVGFVYFQIRFKYHQLTL